MYHKLSITFIWCMVPEIWSATDRTFCNVGLFFVLWPNQQPKNLRFKKKMKKMPGDIIILHKCTKNHDPILYCSWGMARDRHNFYFSFWAIFCSFNPLTTQKIKILKKWKRNAWRYYYFTHVYQKLWSPDVWFLRYGTWQTDRWVDGWLEKVTYRGGCPA